MTKSKPSQGFAVAATTFVLAAAPLALAPTITRGLAAAAWIDHYGAQSSLPRPRRAAARDIAERVGVAVANLAPLPSGSAAATRALDIAWRTEHADKDREAALVIYEGVRAACEISRGRIIGGTGLAVIEARATALRDAARQAARK